MPADPFACQRQGCHYIIGVQGITNTTFALLASTAGHIIALQNGIAQRDHVETGQYQYFSFLIGQNNTDLSIVVTAITGDPDIYVNKDNGTRNLPTSENYQKASTRFGGDTVDWEQAPVGLYWIGVKGYMVSSRLLFECFSSATTLIFLRV